MCLRSMLINMKSSESLLKDIKNNAWVTVNNDFWVTSEAICQWFSRVTWKSLANRITSDPKNRYSRWRMYYSISYTLFYVPGTHNTAKNLHRSLISQLSPRMVFSNFALWHHQSWSVTSRERGILALWRHIRQLFLHAQIGAKVIFTSE